jgi:hypothetical protein
VRRVVVQDAIDVGSGHVVEQGAESSVVVRSDVALIMRQRALFFGRDTFVGNFGCVPWHFHAEKIAPLYEQAAKGAFTLYALVGIAA